MIFPARSIVACATSMMLASMAHADFINGDFEDGTFNGWTQYGYSIPSAIPTFPPTTIGDLGLSVLQANNRSQVRPAGNESATNGGLTWIDQVARVHHPSSGNNYTASGIEQSIIISASDVDADGKVHLRFTAAPVLEAPGHPVEQQPYFFIEVTKADGTSLYHDFNYAQQTGVTWITYGSVQYTDWRNFDIPLDPAKVTIGDQIFLKIVAAGCGQSGHSGAVYVNNVRTVDKVTGSSLNVTATAPATVTSHTNPDGSTDITYTYTYANNGTTTVSGVVVDPIMPVDLNGISTTFVSMGQPSFGGGSCTSPAVGSTDPAHCSIGTLAAGESGTFTMTVRVAPGTTATQVNNGTYPIAGSGVPSIGGPLVQTTLAADLMPNIDNLPANGGTVGTNYPSTASFTCTNRGSTTASGNTLCHVDNLPAGVTTGQCTMAVPPTAPGVNWQEGDAVPPAGVVTCPVTGKPTATPAQPVQGVTGSDNEPAGAAKDNNVVTQTVVAPSLTKAVPTLGEWSFAIMAGLLAGLGFKRRKRIST